VGEPPATAHSAIDLIAEQAVADLAMGASPSAPDQGVSTERAVRLARFADARLYLCTPRQPDFDAFLDGVLAPSTSPAPSAALGAPGVDLIQLREKGLEWRDEAAALERVRAAARRHGALVSGNDRADLASVLSLDILHVGQDDIPPATARRLLGPDMIIGLSTHDERQLEAALADPDVDYFCVGPVWPTPTKEGRPGVGTRLLEAAAAAAPPFLPGSKPWFAIGGIDEERLDTVLAAGARRAVVVRAITGAPDPAAASARLATRLRVAAG